MARKTVLALMAITSCGVAVADDYVGTLRAPQSSFTPAGIYSFASAPTPIASTTDSGSRVKLGYKYSRYFAVEGEVVDFARAMPDPFSSPGNLASAFRSTGFGVDTIAMLPLWRFSFYGRMGAYRGDLRSGFGGAGLLPGEQYGRGTRVRYGLGVRYDFTRSLGVRAEVEHNSAFSSPFANDGEAAAGAAMGREPISATSRTPVSSRSPRTASSACARRGMPRGRPRRRAAWRVPCAPGREPSRWRCS